MTTGQHPDSRQLSAYVLGKLSWPDMAAVDAHLGSCADCRRELEGLEKHSDSFVSCLRGATGEPECDPAYDRLLAGARVRTQLTSQYAGPAPRKLVADCELVDGMEFPGGLGIVCKAYHPLFKKFRAIKRPKAEDGLERDMLLVRFRREVEVAGDLDHLHIVRALQAGVDEEGPYLVMEWLDGEPLSRLLVRHPRLPVPEACALTRQAALGLQAAYERGLVHRDVKPSNLMLVRDGNGAGARVVVIDWGLVRRSSENGAASPQSADGLSSSGLTMGTPDYMAPEQYSAFRSVTIAADVYSLGATLYCLLTGRPPFHDRPRNADKYLAHQQESFPPLEQQRSDVPDALKAVLARMVEKEPARRYANPGEAAAALQPFCCDDAGLRALLDDRGALPPALPMPRRPRSRVWLLAVAASVVLVAVVVGFIVNAKKPPGRTEADDDRRGNVGAGVVGDGSAEPKGAETAPGLLGDGPAEPVRITGHTGHCSSLVFTPDGLRAVSESGGGSVFVWDLQRRVKEKSWPHMSETEYDDLSGAVAVSADGLYIAEAGLNLAPRWMLFVTLTSQKTYRPQDALASFGRMGHALAFSPDSSRLAAVELPGLFGAPKPSVRIIDVPRGTWKTIRGPAAVNGLAFSPDGNFLVTGGDDRSVRLWRLQPQGQEREFTGHAEAVDQVAFSVDGKRIYSASSADGTLRVWSNDGDNVGKEVKQIPFGKSTARMICAAFWPGGRALTGHTDGSVILWDMEKGEELKRFAHKGSQVTAVAVSPDGHHALAALSDHGVYLYRLPPPRAR